MELVSSEKKLCPYDLRSRSAANYKRHHSQLQESSSFRSQQQVLENIRKQKNGQQQGLIHDYGRKKTRKAPEPEKKQKQPMTRPESEADAQEDDSLSQQGLFHYYGHKSSEIQTSKVPKPQTKPVTIVEDYSKLSSSELDKVFASIARAIGPKRRKPTKEDLRDYQRQNLKLAKLALSFHNKSHPELGYKLVKPLESEVFGISRCFIFHTNFVARPKNDPSASPEVFFAEVAQRNGRLKAQRCCSLGHGEGAGQLCKRCMCAKVKHPVDGKYMTGRVEHPSELYDSPGGGS